ncbi:MAG: YciI family protein [Planctomycetota bacterium]|nr:YciI family protein [Planctomycetota bacterium]
MTRRHGIVIGLAAAALAFGLLALPSIGQTKEGAAERMQQFLVFLTPARETFLQDATREEMETVGRHFAYLKQGVDDGKVVMAGRTQDAPPVGLVILEAKDRDAAKAFTEADPTVSGGVFKYELRPYAIALMRAPRNG